jgi:hypothetical protein
MSWIRRLLGAAIAAGALLAVGAPLLAASTPHHPQVGIGDDKTDMFNDPRFLALGMKAVRYDMSWDVLAGGYQTRDVTTWMKDAKAHHLDVLITIDHSKRSVYKVVKVRVKVHGKWVYEKKKKAFSQSRVLPSPAAYLAAFKAFRKRFPWVTNFVTWDETNFKGEATWDKESLIVKYYRELRHACPSCKILAAEFLDVPKSEAVPMATWAKTFIKDLGYQPGYWGLNDYVDANNLRDSNTRGLLAAVKGNIWLAETGGLVARNNHSKVTFPQNAAHAAKVDSYILNKIGSLSPRIQRIYLYEWDAQTKHDSWDSALISYNHQPRQSYSVLAKTLFGWGVKPNCEISRVPPTCTGLGGGGTTGPTGPTGVSGATGVTGATGATG